MPLSFYLLSFLSGTGKCLSLYTQTGEPIYGTAVVRAENEEEALKEGRRIFPENLFPNAADMEIIAVADTFERRRHECWRPVRRQLPQLPLKGKKSRKGTSGQRRRRRRSAATKSKCETEKKE